MDWPKPLPNPIPLKIQFPISSCTPRAFEPLSPVPTPATQIPNPKTQPASFPPLSPSPIDRLRFDGLAPRKLAPQPDAALALTLAHGAYTVQLSSTDARPGDGLIEVYELP